LWSFTLSKYPISRRTVLRGLGTTLALPLLDAMLPARIAAAAPGAATNGAPMRMAFFFVPNGVNPEHWFPAKFGRDYDLPAILQPLEDLRNDVTVISGLKHDKAKANGDGAGDHARSSATFLTGCQARKTSGANIEVGISADQFAAQQIGAATRFASLELGLEDGKLAGNCDSGYSCAYSNTISWRTPSTPVPRDIHPRVVFERLFGSASQHEAAAARAKRDRYSKSILDFVREDAKALNQQLGGADRRKLGEYLDAVREMERRIESAKRDDQRDLKIDMPAPKGTPRHFAEHAQLMGDLFVLALQTDQTRIASFMLANEGSNRSYNEIGVREGHHSLSHHGRSAAKLADITKINTFHMEQFAYILKKMKSIKEGPATLLDNSMIVYGCAIRDGDRHDHTELPVLLAGKGGGTIKTAGQHIRVNQEPMANLFLSMFDRMGVKCDRLGDSTGRLKAIDA
jgi:hypothetical protein